MNPRFVKEKKHKVPGSNVPNIYIYVCECEYYFRVNVKKRSLENKCTFADLYTNARLKPIEKKE